jgi:hypothetical protein
MNRLLTAFLIAMTVLGVNGETLTGSVNSPIIKGSLSSNDVSDILALAQAVSSSQTVWLIQERLLDKKPMRVPSACVYFRSGSTSEVASIGKFFICYTFDSATMRDRVQADYDRRGLLSGYVIAGRWYLLADQGSGNYGIINSNAMDSIFYARGDLAPAELPGIGDAITKIFLENAKMSQYLPPTYRHVNAIEKMADGDVKVTVGSGRGYSIVIRKTSEGWIVISVSEWIT